MRFVDAARRQGVGLDELRRGVVGGGEDRLGKVLSGVERMFADAERVAEDGGVGALERVVAAALLTRAGVERWRELGLGWLAGWLQPRVGVEVQVAAVRALAATGAATVPDRLLGGWKGLGPGTRAVVLDVLLARSEWAAGLLEAVAAGKVELSAMDATTRGRLMRHGSATVRELAGRVFGAAAGSGRASVVAAYRPALDLRGDPGRGVATYDRLCLTCHRRDGQGNEVGPDLRSVAGHAPEKLLASILDPSGDVQPGFHAYHAVLKGGEEVYGRIAAETGNSVVMLLLDGTSRTVRRSDLEEMRGSALSLMPEGLEEGLSVQDMADLLAYLKRP